MDHSERREERERMVAEQIEARGLTDPALLRAFHTVPRHVFVPQSRAELAYEDFPLPIGAGQTISQPYIVAYMIACAEIGPEDRVLDVGCGSGYQTAILAEMGREVFGLEIVADLAERAQATLSELGYRNVDVRVADGSLGLAEQAPFDAILAAAASREVPAALEEQLAEGGRLVMPVGEDWQQIIRVRRTPKGLEREQLVAVRFVPMTGEAPKGRHGHPPRP